MSASSLLSLAEQTMLAGILRSSPQAGSSTPTSVGLLEDSIAVYKDVMADKPFMLGFALGQHLVMAAKEDRPDAIRCLVNGGADIDWLSPEGYNPLHLAILENNAAAVSELCACGADINAPYTLHPHHRSVKKPGFSGNHFTARSHGSPLHLALERRLPRMVDLLLELGANPDFTTPSIAETPLELVLLEEWESSSEERAREKRMLTNVRTFDEYDVDLLRANEAGAIPLILSLRKEGFESVSTYLATSAQYAQDVLDQALDRAVALNYCTLIPVLLDAGANVEAGIEGKTLLEANPGAKEATVMLINAALTEVAIKRSLDETGALADAAPLRRSAPSPI
jgi:ankyrin repeat protein